MVAYRHCGVNSSQNNCAILQFACYTVDFEQCIICYKTWLWKIYVSFNLKRVVSFLLSCYQNDVSIKRNL